MDVILLAAVEKLGDVGAKVQVAPGFARNYLIPRGLAVAATPQQLRAVEERIRQDAKQRQRAQEQAHNLKQRLEAASLTLKLAVGTDDKPFGSVTLHDILEALKHQGLEIEKRALQLKEPIKTLGVYEIPVRLPADVTATVKVWVVKA